MEPEKELSKELQLKPSCSENPSSNQLELQGRGQEWERLPGVSCGTVTGPPIETLSSSSGIQLYNEVETVSQDDLDKLTSNIVKIEEWDAKAMLNNLQYLDQKIHQVQDMVQLIVDRKNEGLGQPDEYLAQQQKQQVAAELTSVIVQLISTAGSLLPSVASTLTWPSPAIKRLDGPQVQSSTGIKTSSISDSIPRNINSSFEDHELKGEDEVDDGDTLPHGSFEILQLEEEEILALHTHFCTICGKGFKRDANLRMHMRGHGDEYKTPAALAKPSKESTCEAVLKRYSCPFTGCKRNKNHKKFQPSKTILCVKNHYKRTHCSKSYVCSRCNSKKFSVMADLKTHEKHCGKDKWLCSCGTTFSRKDKLFGHISLFQGHTPAITSDEAKGSVSISREDDFHIASNDAFAVNFGNAFSGAEIQSIMDGKIFADDSVDCFSALSFDSCNFDGFHDLTRHPFDGSENPRFPF